VYGVQIILLFIYKRHTGLIFIANCLMVTSRRLLMVNDIIVYWLMVSALCANGAIFHSVHVSPHALHLQQSILFVMFIIIYSSFNSTVTS